MTITIHAQGAERKRLVQTISAWLGVPAKYCGAPTFNYEVDYFTIDRNGSLSFDDRADSEVIERLLTLARRIDRKPLAVAAGLLVTALDAAEGRA